jgi:acyl-CoA synthetase (AMP-forming)/AMP-acid ligase II
VRARLGSVGRPLPTLEVSIRDADGNPVPEGEHGEIWVRGEQVSGEYLGREARAEEGWFPTRDAGHVDEGGYLFVHGRLDDVIVRGGENLSPGEIEEVLVSHPAVEQAAVIGIPSDEWGEQVVAAVVLAEGATAGEGELQELVRSRLRSTKTPEHIQFRAELPFNETGKLLRRVLRDELTEEYRS